MKDVTVQSQEVALAWLVVLKLRGDCVWHCSPFKFLQWNAGGNMSWVCRAEGAEIPLCFSSCHPHAGGRSTRRMHEDCERELIASNHEPPTLFQVLGFRIECVMIDLLGFGSHIIGNVMWLCDTTAFGVALRRKPT